jgi:hypothetical protein
VELGLKSPIKRHFGELEASSFGNEHTRQSGGKPALPTRDIHRLFEFVTESLSIQNYSRDDERLRVRKVGLPPLLL